MQPKQESTNNASQNIGEVRLSTFTTVIQIPEFFMLEDEKSLSAYFLDLKFGAIIQDI